MEKQKFEPQSPFECWHMSCSECIYYNSDTDKCLHPDCYPGSSLYPGI